MTTFSVFIWLIILLTFTTGFAVAAKKYGVQFLTAGMALTILITMIANLKFVSILGYAIPAGTLIFSMTFLISDMLSEFWGKKEAHKAVWAGFTGILLYLIVIFMTMSWEAAPFAIEAGEKFRDLFIIAPRIAIGSVAAYVIAQNFDVWLYHQIKKYTKDKYLWFRNNVSTIISQFIDSIVFFTVAFLGTAAFPSLDSLWVPIVTIWLIKVIIAIFDTPFIYLLRSILKKFP